MEFMQKVDSVAKTLGVTASAVKKYYSLFEKEGYKFKRSNEGYVLFSDHDVDLLKELIVLKNQPEMTLAKAVRHLAKSEGITNITDITDMDMTNMSVIKGITDIKDMFHQQQEENRQLIDKVEQLQHQLKLQEEANVQLQEQTKEYIEEKFKEADRVQELRVSMLIKQQALAEVSAAQEKEKEKKKGFFSRLLGK